VAQNVHLAAPAWTARRPGGGTGGRGDGGSSTWCRPSSPGRRGPGGCTAAGCAGPGRASSSSQSALIFFLRRPRCCRRAGVSSARTCLRGRDHSSERRAGRYKYPQRRQGAHSAWAACSRRTAAVAQCWKMPGASRARLRHRWCAWYEPPSGALGAYRPAPRATGAAGKGVASEMQRWAALAFPGRRCGATGARCELCGESTRFPGLPSGCHTADGPQ
jgi:hypothetical protein